MTRVGTDSILVCLLMPAADLKAFDDAGIEHSELEYQRCVVPAATWLP